MGAIKIINETLKLKHLLAQTFINANIKEVLFSIDMCSNPYDISIYEW